MKNKKNDAMNKLARTLGKQAGKLVIKQIDRAIKKEKSKKRK